MTIATLRTDEIANASRGCTPKFAKIDAASSGNNTLIAAVTGKKIRVLAGMLYAGGTVTAKFQSGASGTDLTGGLPLANARDVPIPFCQLGNFETAADALLNLNLSAAVQVSGWVVYIEV